MRHTITGGEIIFDAKDKGIILCHKWHVSSKGYVRRSIPGGAVYLHKEMMCDKGGIVDHRNGDKLDNRRKNLRYVTHSQNNMNRGGVKGVYYSNNKKRWIAVIKRDGKRTDRHFINLNEAIEARRQMEMLYFGEYARK